MEQVKTDEKNKLTEKQKMILYFFVYAFLGWILETIFCIVTTGTFTKRGFLYGTLCPIYGFGAIILIQCLKSIKANTIGKFFIAMISFTIFEYIASAILEDIFGLRWWDYSNDAFNFQGRISLAYSIAWGILGVIFVEKIHPNFEKRIEPKVNRFSNITQNIVLYMLSGITLVDFILSIIKYLKV